MVQNDPQTADVCSPARAWISFPPHDTRDSSEVDNAVDTVERALNVGAVADVAAFGSVAADVKAADREVARVQRWSEVGPDEPR